MADISKLANSPDSYRDLVEADLRRAARLILRVQDEIDPQIRMATPDGDYHMAVTLPDGDDQRCQMLRRIKTLMAWKQVMASLGPRN